LLAQADQQKCDLLFDRLLFNRNFELNELGAQTDLLKMRTSSASGAWNLNDMQEGISQSPILRKVPQRPGVINCASYAHGVRVANVEIADISEELKHEDQFVWVGLFEPDEQLLREIQEEFGLRDLAVEDALAAHRGRS